MIIINEKMILKKVGNYFFDFILLAFFSSI